MIMSYILYKIRHMTIYILNILSIFLWKALFRTIYSKEKSDNLTMKIICFQMILIAGFRSVTVGTDTITYQNIFEATKNMNLIRLFTYYIEPGYMIINKLIYLICTNYHFFLIFSGIIIYYGIYQLINNTSNNKIMSIFLFISIGYFSSSMNIMRQYYALTIIIVAIIKYLRNEKLSKVFILIAISSTIHYSAILMIPVIFLHYIMFRSKFKEFTVFKYFCFLGGLLSLLFLNSILPALFSSGLSKYDFEFAVVAAGYETSIISFNLLIKIMCSLLYFYEKKYLRLSIAKINDLSFWNYMNVFSCLIYIAAGYVSLLSRVNLYFSIISIIFLPNLFDNIKNKSIRISLYIVFLIVYILTLPSKDTVPWIFGI